MLSVETQNGMEINRATDPLGRNTGFSLAGSDYAVSYAYDMFGRFHSLASASSATSAVAFAYSYLPGTDLLSGMSASGGFSWTREYEPHRDLVTSVENRHGTNLISRFDYANDLLARRTRKVR